MKDIVSLLLTTSCLAITGIGIYFFSYKSDEDEDVTQKAGKKHISSTEDKYIDYDDKDYDSNNFDNNYIDYDNDYNYKTKNKTKSNNKTKKNRNKFTSSKKKMYH